MMIRSGYLDHVFTPEKLKETVRLAKKKLRQIHKVNPFDTIVFTGISGAALGFTLSYETGFPVAVVRKSGESTHSSYRIEGNCGTDRYLLLDDFIEGGHTIRRIIKRMEENLKTKPKCAAVLLHAPVPGNANIGDGDLASGIVGRLPDVPVYSLDW